VGIAMRSGGPGAGSGAVATGVAEPWAALSVQSNSNRQSVSIESGSLHGIVQLNDEPLWRTSRVRLKSF
jgi:hypothetical protein